MDRKRFLELCQRYSFTKNKSCLVKYKDSVYYPYGYIMTFKDNGEPEHTAMMKDLKANAVYYGVLSKVEESK
jgi:hypothetical protein